MTTIQITKWTEASYHVNVTQADFDAHQIAEIEAAVCEAFGLTDPLALHQKTRKSPIAFARQVAMVLLMDAMKMSARAVVAHFGLSDGSTVTHARKVVRDSMEVYPREKSRIQGLMTQFGLGGAR